MTRSEYCFLVFIFFFIFNHWASKRRDDGGNLKNVSYSQKKNDEKVNKDLLLYLKTSKLEYTLRGMAFIPGCSNYKLGTAQKNNLEKVRNVSIKPFLIDKTLLTVCEFNKYLKILLAYHKSVNNNADINIYQYTSAATPASNKNKKVKSEDEDVVAYPLNDDEDVYNQLAKDEEGNVDISLEKYVQDYLKLRNEFREKIMRREYIYNMLPWYSNSEDDYNKFLEEYYTDPQNKNKPAIGLNWEQCNEIAILRTVYCNEHLLKNRIISRDMRFVVIFSLPDYKQWCLAAEGNEGYCLYGWGSISLVDEKGKACGNFNSPEYENGQVYTSDVNKYKPNSNDLYDMSGNVWEWLSENDSAYIPSTNKEEMRMIVGGCYASEPRELEIGTYIQQHIYTSKPTIGVRFIANVFTQEPNQKKK